VDEQSFHHARAAAVSRCGCNGHTASGCSRSSLKLALAGEHASYWPGWMQGSLLSAKSAMEEFGGWPPRIPDVCQASPVAATDVRGGRAGQRVEL
jgi:hypothetical protein